MRASYDFIIVGAGSSGCVLAARLSEDPRRTVLLIESGPPDDHWLIAMPMGIGRLNVPGNPYHSEYAASPGGNRPAETWVKGRTLGGSSSVNGMVYVRGAPADYDGWAAQGCTGWGWDEIGRCFAEIEDHALGAGEGRGTGGPLHVTLSTARDALGDAVIAAAAQAGTPTVADINGIDAVRDGGFGRQPRTIWRGRRLSAATAFLKPALARPNLDVVTDTEVVRVELEGLRARGVRIVRDGAPHIVLAEGEVILCAGAIASPALLQRSGIGPAALLRAAGIQPIVDSPDVGRNLREHRTVSIHYRLTRGGHNAALRGIGLAGSVARYVLAKSGALTNATFDVGGFVKTAPGLDRPDGQIGVGLFSFGGKGIADYPGMTMFGYFMRPQSRGTLAIRSPDPAVAPVIDANFMAAPIDRERTVALLRHIRTIGAQPALAPHIAAETLPGVDCTSDEDLIEASFRFGSTGYHIAGTCRMGGNPDAVLDPLLRVRGIAGLRVVDTSIMPELVSGNTNAPAMAIAWRAAELILQGDGGSGIRTRGERETAG